MVMGLVFVAQASTFMLDSTKREGLNALAGIHVVAMLAIAGAFVGVAGQALYRRFVPGVLYGAFLAHHKGSAGCLARYVKIRMGILAPNDPVFLDSDEPTDLDGLLEIVRAKTK